MSILSIDLDFRKKDAGKDTQQGDRRVDIISNHITSTVG